MWFYVTKIEKFEGDSAINIRKGKKIVSYDYSCKLKFECKVTDSEGTQLEKVTGEYELPEVSSEMETDGEEWEVRVSFDSDVKDSMNNLIRKVVPKKLRGDIMEGYVKELRAK